MKHKATAEDFDDLNTEIARLLAVELPLKFDKTGGALSGILNEAQGADIASGTTTNLATATGNSVKITGTTTITGFGTVQAGTCMNLTFTGILTITYNATSMILPKAGENITTAVGDSAIFTSLGSGNWKCLSYTKADGTALVVVPPGFDPTTTQNFFDDFMTGNETTGSIGEQGWSSQNIAGTSSFSVSSQGSRTGNFRITS